MARFSALSRTSIQILTIVCTLASANVLALGLGGIDLKSGLNQPLNAEIEITGATADELRRLKASIASRETFTRYGLEFPQYLNSLEFSVSRNAAGQDVLRVRSREPMDEPFVTFLVEAEWARGRLLREYTVLLDPPVYLPDQSPANAPVVSTPRSSSSQPSSTSGTVSRPAPAPTPFTAPAATAPVVQAPSSQSGSGVVPGSTTGPVRRGDSLWGVANRSRPQNVTVNQMMVALYRANPDAFMGNMNLLRQGARLRVPTEGEIAAITRNEAFSVVKQETASWRGAPAAVASASTPASGSSAGAGGSGAGTADAKLKLVAPDGQADAGGGTALQDAQATIERATAENMALNERATALEAQLSEARRLLQLKDAELAQLQATVSGAEPGELASAVDPVTGVGVDLESQALDGATDTDTGIDGAADADGSYDDVALGSLTQDALAGAQSDTAALEAEPEPVDTTRVVVPPAPEPPGFFASLLSSPLKAIGSIGMLLALVAGGLLLRQRRSDSAADTLEALAREDDNTSYSEFDSGFDPVATQAADLGDDLPEFEDEFSHTQSSPAATAEVAQPVETGIFEETGTFKPVDFDTALNSEETQQTEYVLPESDDSDVNLDQADPVSEADFHMAYGLYDQAADLINKALEREPDRRDLQVKLLEILFVWGNRDEFRSTAARLQSSLMDGADGDWDKIAIMGKQICPEDDLFLGGSVTEADVDIDLQASAETPMEVDFDAAAPGDDVIDLDLRGALTEETDGLIEDTAVTNMSDFEGLGLDDDLADSLNEAADFSMAGFEDADVDGTMPATEMQDDPQLHDIARRLEQRMTPVASTEDDIGMSLDLGQTIAPETAENPTLSEADFASDGEGAGDEVFGDFFAFTGVTEDADADEQTQRAPDLVLDATGEMLPEQHTGEFPIELPDDDFDIDLSDLAGSDDATQRSGTLSGDTQALGLPSMDDGDSDTSVVNAAEMLSGLGEGSEMTQTTESPMMPPPSHARSEKDINTLQAPLLNEDDLLNSGDATVSTNVLDLDIGDSVMEDKPSTVRVPAAELALPSGDDSGLDEVGTKLDLARAYIDMGDSDGARSILEEVIMEGDDTQKKDAGGLLQSL